MRDLANISALEAAGWNVLIVWECQLKNDPDTLEGLAEKLHVIASGHSVC